MTDLTARELMDTILRSLVQTRAAFKKAPQPSADDRAGVISFNFGDIHAHDLASILDTEGVCVRAGHHCTMPLMEKMGWPATARASFYLYNTEEDVDALVLALEKAAEVFRLS